ncbi:hypothetical protein [Hymenobacter ruricola]|uniref:Uncharacterized protein n=1 Tax=Hymenobacter ruricola TaxID=2791023 RepID=A0ABS0HYX0_9BACT|nr:hypothetical protein [Hymenobacter ruricola]MBF9219901.1 hypothetical protein [Hymenobacter ruricola]
MQNPFAKPHTLEQWLASSLCWTLACVGGWLGLATLFERHLSSENADFFILSSFWLAHSLIWWQALSGGEEWLQFTIEVTSVAKVAGCIWYATLTVFQIATLLIGGVWTLASLVFF